MMMRGNEFDVLRIAKTPEEVLSAVWAFDEELVVQMAKSIAPLAKKNVSEQNVHTIPKGINEV